jgi:hypothetical protein
MLKPLFNKAAIAKYPPQEYGEYTAPVNSMTLLKNPLSGGTPANARKKMVMLKAVCGMRRARPLKESKVFRGSLVATAAAATKAAVFTME